MFSIRGSQNEKKSAAPVKANNVSQAKKGASSTHDIPSSVVPTVLSAKTKTAITRQWFEAIQNKIGKNNVKYVEGVSYKMEGKYWEEDNINIQSAVNAAKIKVRSLLFNFLKYLESIIIAVVPAASSLAPL